MGVLPYCGAAPSPGELAARFNWDPVLLLVLASLAASHLLYLRNGTQRLYAAWGWVVATFAFVSPLCALSVALFCARVFQHMVLVLVAAPLTGAGTAGATGALGSSMALGRGVVLLRCPLVLAYAGALRGHLPLDAHLLGDARDPVRQRHPAVARAAATAARDISSMHWSWARLSSMQMGLLGAVLTMASRPLFLWHLTTTQVWGLTPLRGPAAGRRFHVGTRHPAVPVGGRPHA